MFDHNIVQTIMEYFPRRSNAPFSAAACGGRPPNRKNPHRTKPDISGHNRTSTGHFRTSTGRFRTPGTKSHRFPKYISAKNAFFHQQESEKCPTPQGWVADIPGHPPAFPAQKRGFDVELPTGKANREAAKIAKKKKHGDWYVVIDQSQPRQSPLINHQSPSSRPSRLRGKSSTDRSAMKSSS
jgi:hypothetical protein